MTNAIVLGMQWGDEGKGKIVDLICPAFDAVVRFQGGNNAGHTVKFGGRHFALHFLPSGILHPGMACVLGNGMVIHPEAFFDELHKLAESGVDAGGRLFVSARAQVILPPHLHLDAAREAARGGGKIGTTARGIGPAYETKAARSGLRACDLVAEDVEERVAVLRGQLAAELAELGAEVPETGELATACRYWGERLAPYLADTAVLVNRWIDDGKSVLFEGAQGALLDVDHGTYPYVTSSNTVAGGVTTGAGVAPTRIGGVLGVVKAYTTRVGSGPFVGELEDETGDFLRRRGNEYGTTTGRPRRCGWLDAVATRYAQLLNRADALAVTKLDVLDELDEVRVCVGYRWRGEVVRDFPAELAVLEQAQPELRTFPGWRSSTVGVLHYEDLPQQARDFLAFVEDEVGTPVGMVSTGPRREETIVRDAPEMTRLVSGRVDRVLAHRDVSA
jgi:adenylosuccinate synthase